MANSKTSDDFHAQIDLLQQASLDSPFKSSHISLGDTPDIYTHMGFQKLPLLATSKHIYTMIHDEGFISGVNYHNLGSELVKKIPQGISDPLIVMQSKTIPEALVVITELKDKNQNPLLVSLLPNGTGNYHNVEINANILTSAYGKEQFQHFLEQAENDNRILFFNNKKSHTIIPPSLQLASNYDRHGFSQQNIQRYLKSVKELTTQLIEPIFLNNDLRIINNHRLQRIQITFSEKPSVEVIDDLKHNGWLWSPKNYVWQRKNTENGIASAKQIQQKWYPEAMLQNTMPKKIIPEDALVKLVGNEKANQIIEELKKDEYSIESIHKKLFTSSPFDQDLLKLEKGELPEGFIFNLGKPNTILQQCGFPADQNIELAASRLLQKADRHSYSPLDVKGLDVALQSPVAVFSYGDSAKSQNVIVYLEKDGKNFLAGVFFNQKQRGIEVSDIRGIFNKDNHEWLHWIEQGKLIYANKEKIQETVNQQRINRAEVEYLNLDSIQSILNSFPSVKHIFTKDFPEYLSLSNNENPSINQEKNNVSKKLVQPEFDFFDASKDNHDLVKPESRKSQGIFSPVITGNIYDYTGVKANAIMLVDPKTILDNPRPSWIPDIDVTHIKRFQFIPPMQKIENNFFLKIDDKEIRMTPEVFAGTLDYYIKYAKAHNKKEVQKKNNERIENAKETIKAFALIPADQLIKQQIFEMQYYSEVVEGKRQLKEPRLSIMSPNKMSKAQYDLLSGSRQERWNIYTEMRRELSQKISDMTFQKDDFESVYTKGQLTSYGDSGTQKTLLDSHGVLIKRQNGSLINEKETQEIKNALDTFFHSLFNLRELSKEYGLKVSHAGDRFMHARDSAVGIFSPHYKAIGVSFGKLNNPEWTVAHEYGHFLDHITGQETNHYFRSDQTGSMEYDIATRFRSSMEKTQDSQYQNRTCECFARAFQEYSAYRMQQLPDFLDEHNTIGNYVNQKLFIKEFVPKFERLIEERQKLYQIDKKELDKSRKNNSIEREQ
jgi:hypothetical protein